VAYFEVILQYQSGRPADGVKVSNSWDSKDHFTNAEGKVLIEAGSPDLGIFVHGKSYGRVKPGKTLLTLDR
jgi:hypothetical protein